MPSAMPSIPRAGYMWAALRGGEGKSHLAAAIAHAAATRGLAVAYASTPDLLRFVRRGGAA